MDDIFKIRFIEEIELIVKEKDAVNKRKLKSFAVISFILMIGSTFGLIELIYEMIVDPTKVEFVNFVIIIIFFGFAITFLLTSVIFMLAYIKYKKMKSCFADFSCVADKKEVSPGDEVNVDLKFGLTKRHLKEVRARLYCEKETTSRVADLDTVRRTYPHDVEIVLANGLTPQKEPYSFSEKLTIPKDAPLSQPELTDDTDKIVWRVTVYFDFLDWHTHEEDLPLVVV